METIGEEEAGRQESCGDGGGQDSDTQGQKAKCYDPLQESLQMPTQKESLKRQCLKNFFPYNNYKNYVNNFLHKN